MQNQGIRKGPYPFWSTDGEIEMDDIIDDGLPPDERAGMHRTLHVMLTVEVRDLLVRALLVRALLVDATRHAHCRGTCFTSSCFTSTCMASSWLV